MWVYWVLCLCRYRAATGCRISSWYLNDDEPCFSSELDAAPHHHTVSTKRCYSIGAAISKALSASCPHFDPMIQVYRQYLDSSLNMTFLHMFRFQLIYCQHKQACQWRAVMAELLAALWDQTLALCSLSLTVWAEGCQAYCPTNLDCKFVEDWQHSS